MYKFLIISIFFAILFNLEAPYTYDFAFTHRMNDCSGIQNNCNKGTTPFGKIEIMTRYSPPTNVTWKRDGKIVYEHPHEHPHVGEDCYDMTQVVTDRAKDSEYSSFLLIYNAAHLPGNHTYEFIVTNYEGTIITDLDTKVKGIYIPYNE